MMYDAAMRTVQRGDKHFRWRGENVSRVETLFDSVMALSMTLVIVSLEVPERYSDLAEWNPHRDVCVSANRVRGGFMFTSMRWSHRRYALLVPLLALVTGCGFPLVFANELAEGEFNRRLSVSGPVELTARAGSGNITIQTGQTGIVQVKATVRARARTMAAADDKLARLLADPPVTQDGNHVEVGRIPDRELRRSVSISYVITVPDTTAVDANVGSGRISVDGVVGPVDAHIGSGHVLVSNVDDDVSARAGSGRIELDTIAGDVDVKTGSGRLALAGLSGGLTAATGSGRVEAQGRPSNEWRVRTGSGRVTLTLPADAAFDITARSGSGGVDIEHPVASTGRTTSTSVTGTVGGGGDLVDVRTGSGRIRIEESTR
jgi:hypothetical protein